LPPTIDDININAIDFIDYRNQYGKVVDEAATLFKLPTESNLLKLFLDHIKNNKHAKNSIREQKTLSAWKAGPS
jgi:hypothetical protein